MHSGLCGLTLVKWATPPAGPGANPIQTVAPFLLKRIVVVCLDHVKRETYIAWNRPYKPDGMSLQESRTIRKRVVLTGILQGIGCRPTVYRLARGLELGGWVSNTTSRVLIEIEGTADQCSRFLADLPEAIPFPGRIDTTEATDVPVLGETAFRIQASREEQRSTTPIPPDVAVCPECVEELFDPTNHRYLYPFITCTLCGPRFTVVRAFPYDRERTSMADFMMCPRCRDEYESPPDRRFHSQTNSCPVCGPRMTLVYPTGRPIEGDPLLETVHLLGEGKIVAVKGIGGFHLACNACSPEAVARLRERKGRGEKPFAVMMPDLATVRRFCPVSEDEARLLTAPVAPIVLLDAAGERLAGNVSPWVGTVGVMLPYSPVHHLLFRHPQIPASRRPTALVMTSGNRSEEPIVKGNDEALERLGHLADAFLCHEREIVLRVDDSICRVIAGRHTVFRRSRGLVPAEFKFTDAEVRNEAAATNGSRQDLEVFGGGGQGEGPFYKKVPPPVILGSGGDLKNSLAVLKGDRVVPGPHVGDLGSPVAQEYFEQSIDVLTRYLEAAPEIIAADPHPEYFSNRLVRELGVRVEEVYHHHAHAVSLLFEHGLEGPALFAVFDGTGYGTDGTIWGGEFLLADRASFTRLGHLRTFPLPGGEAAIREPIRILAGLLALSGCSQDETDAALGGQAAMSRFWGEMVAKGINSPVTSSAGRLFDAAAAAAGFRWPVTFEGQAAMWLEGIADPRERGHYPVRIYGERPFVVDTASLILEVVRDILGGAGERCVSAKFHGGIAHLITEAVKTMSDTTGLRVVGLTGGCFQNKLLTERTLSMLTTAGFRVLLHEAVPPNDGGIAVGQVVSVRARSLYGRA